MSVCQLFYVSKASKNFEIAKINDILKKAQSFNASKNITGILMFRGRIFLQLLEGEKDAVISLFNKIKSDDRHAHVTQLFLIEGKERLFNEWAMGFYEVSDFDVKIANEVLSWNRLISAAKDIDNHLILHMLERFKPKVQSKKAS